MPQGRRTSYPSDAGAGNARPADQALGVTALRLPESRTKCEGGPPALHGVKSRLGSQQLLAVRDR